MTLMDVYSWLKALHVACALLFVGGLVANSLILVAGPAATHWTPPLTLRLRR
jgi:putative membrane protein